MRTAATRCWRRPPWLGAGPGPLTSIVLGVAALLVAGSGVIHLHLWDAGYRAIPTIGPLFLAQGIGAVVLAVALAVVRRLSLLLVTAGLVAGTLGGFLISVNVGFFGFQDSFRAPFAGLAFGEEIVALVALVIGGWLLFALGQRQPRRTGRHLTRLPRSRPRA